MGVVDPLSESHSTMGVAKAHTIILSQATSAEASRTFTDHPTVSDAIESAFPSECESIVKGGIGQTEMVLVAAHHQSTYACCGGSLTTCS